VAAVTVYSAPDDGRKGRPKHVEHKLHGYTVHQIMLNTFYYQLTHTTLKNVELLKNSKIDKNAPTCFGLHGNHLQGAKVSTWLNLHFWLRVDA